MKKNTERGDLHLIQETLNGNRETENCLYEKYKKVVNNYIRKKYSDYPEIDDDISEIMVRVFMNLCTYDEKKSKFKTWVISISKNYLIDKWRQYQNCITFTAGNTVTLDDCEGVAFFTSSFTSDEFEVSNNGYSTSSSAEFENCNTLTYLSSQVNTADYQLLDMKYAQGYNYTEIGNEFNLSSSTISNRVNYLKSKLKKNNGEEVLT